MKVAAGLVLTLCWLGCGPENIDWVENESHSVGILRQPEYACVAEEFLTPIEYGFWPWEEELSYQPFHGYLDLAVRNYHFEKRITLKLTVGRENRTVERYLYHLSYKGQLEDGRERWGTDAIKLYDFVEAHGRITFVDATFKVVDDAGNECNSTTRYGLELTPFLRESSQALTNLRLFTVKPNEASRLLNSIRTALGRKPFGENESVPIEVYFAPYDNPEEAIIREINHVIEAQSAQPEALHTIRGSIFDINDARIVDRLIVAHEAGVKIKLLTAAHHLEPYMVWETEYPRLQRAGVEVIGVVHEGVAASNHTKFAIFDEEVVTTGSLNWDERAAEHNNENLLIIRSQKAAAIYGEMLRAIEGGPKTNRPIPPNGFLSIYYSQQHTIPAVLAREIDRADTTIDIAMFQLRPLKFWNGGHPDDVLDHLIAAQERGVRVRILLEKNIADEGEYYGRITPDDSTDEWLMENGIQVTKIRTHSGGDRYAAMHHKFAVIDQKTLLVGAYNWYEPSERSDDDMIVVRDSALAQRFTGEFTNLHYHYGDTFDADAFETSVIEIELYHPHTQWGDTLHLVGSISPLGNWDPLASIAMDSTHWPRWTTQVEIPAGVHFEYKFFIQNSRGLFWEAGKNRVHTTTSLEKNETLFGIYR